jgi:peptidoglycan hydrolase CwlO-like protein
MKKKLFIAIATGVFIISMMVNLSVSQKNSSGNLSLNNIKVMSVALAEYNGVTCPGGACKSNNADCEACCGAGQKAVCDYWECRCDDA